MLSELATWRQETRGCSNRTHLNNAGAALMPAPVADAIIRHLRKEEDVGGYEAADTSAREIQQTYETLARLINAKPRNIAVVENATVAIALALSSFPLSPNHTIITSKADYPSNQLMYRSLSIRHGVRVIWAEDLPEGGVDPDSIRALLRSHDKTIVSLTWVPTNSGLVQNVAAVGDICAEQNVPYIIDACQAVGQIHIDLTALRCDFLAASARKFLRGPRGIGFLYVSDHSLKRGAQPLFVDMRGAEWIAPNLYHLVPDARRFENWEFPYALVLGQGTAAEYALKIGDTAFSRTRELTDYLRNSLQSVDGLRQMDRGAQRCAIVTLHVRGWDMTELMLELRRRRLNTSVSSREDGVIDMDGKGVKQVLRVSPHYYNTLDELDDLVAQLRDLTQRGARMARSSR